MTRKESREDAISRQAVLKVIKNLYPGIPVVDINGARLKWLRKYKPYFECEKVVEQLPSITPQPKTGHWINFKMQGEIDGQIVQSFTCSECGAISIFRMASGNIVNGDLCANCGAKMQEDKE